MERSAKDASAVDALRKVIADALPTTVANRGMWRIWVGFWERSSYNPDVARVMRLRYDEWRNRLAVIIRRAQDQGEMPSDFDADLAAQELIAVIDGIAVQVLLGVGKIPAARQREMIETRIAVMAAGAPSLPSKAKS